jgi:hypothetical protein|tara:strand:- start:483 stop:662 length:180 start_codon:yes stop_codon:yes gene_type:complete
MKKITISSEDITPKQWTNLVLELNLIKKAWKPYADLQLKAPNIKKIILAGNVKFRTILK